MRERERGREERRVRMGTGEIAARPGWIKVNERTKAGECTREVRRGAIRTKVFTPHKVKELRNT